MAMRCGVMAVFAAAMLCGLGAGAPQQDATSLEGKKAPGLSLKTIDGKSFVLAGLKGNVVLMDYWATWCPPCKKSLPHIEELSKDKELAVKGLKVFAINDKEMAPEVRAFVKENNYTFTVPLDVKGEFGKAYKVTGIPTTVIVGRDGVVAKVFVGFGDGSEKQIRKAVEEALAVEYVAPTTKPAK